MAQRLSSLELRIMEIFWSHGPASVREVQERFPPNERPAYTTVQTVIYRLEAKRAVRRTKKIGNAHVFEAVVSRRAAHRRIVNDVLALFGGRVQPLVAQLVEAGKLTEHDLRDAEAALQRMAAEERKRR